MKIGRCTALGLLMMASATAPAATLPPVVRGQKAVMLRVEKAPLQIKLYKRDLNIYEGDDLLHAVVYDPQRRIVATLDLGDDGLPRGQRTPELQSVDATLPEAGPGVYRLQVSGGDDYVWGLETNAPGCVLHGDVLFNDGSISGRLLFAPPPQKFAVKAQALHAPGQQQMPLFDDRRQVLKTFDLSKQGIDQVLEVPAGVRGGLWQFDIAHMDVKIIPDRPFWWTLDSNAWFDPEKTRWMLLPYRQARYLKPGERALVRLGLRNSSGVERAFMVDVSAPAGVSAVVTQPALPVTLKVNARQSVVLAVALARTAKAGTRLPLAVSAKAADDPTVAVSAGVEVRVAQAPLARRLDLPIALRPYEHENWQFGYAPEYAPNEVYFDLNNHPYMRQRGEDMYTSTGLQVLENGHWFERPFGEAIRRVFPSYRGSAYGAGGFLGAKIAFDGDNGAYTLMRLSLDNTRQSALLYTPDAGKSYQVYALPDTDFDIEQFTGHNALQTPPPILVYQFVKPHPAEFAGYHDLLLLLPGKVDGKLVLGDPVKVAENCVGSCQHSGGPASLATRAGKTHIVWGEIAPEETPGVPTYVATYDHATGQVSPKVLLGYAPPVNDVHNVPAICQDSQGYLHVVLGAHGQAFQYTRSLKPNDAASGWTKVEPVLTAGYVDDKTDADGDGRQTYCSLVCRPDDKLHIAYRQWRRGVDQFHPGEYYAALSVQSKPKQGPWGPAQPIVVPPVPGYSIYYHKLTIDRRGRLYLSYSYWTTDEYQEDFPDRYHNPAVVMSADGGKTWKLATTSDFAAGIAR